MACDAVFSSLFFRLYTGLWRVARPLLRRNARLAEGWAERCVPAGWMDGETPVDLWIQAASGGEAHLAAALLKAMPERPVLRVLVSTWTRQGRQVIEAAMPALRADKPWLSVVVRYAPLDEPGVVRRAVKMAAPRALVLLETELWPGLMGACAEAGVPLYVINGRMTKTSYEFYRIIEFVLRRLPVRAIHAVSAGDARRFARVFGRSFGREEPPASRPESVSVMPNIKFDRAVETLSARPRLNLAPVFRDVSHLVLLASVRREEETRIGPWIERLLRAWPDGAVVVAPRHMHRVDAWMSRLCDLGLRPLAASELDGGGSCPPGSVLVWDRFGELSSLYAVADVAFVGGSFGSGGQNFLEALAAGLVPCVGPSLDNFHWALGLEPIPGGPVLPSLEAAGLLRVCSSPRAACECLLSSPVLAREDVRARFLAWLKPRAGGAAYAARILDAALNNAGQGPVLQLSR